MRSEFERYGEHPSSDVRFSHERARCRAGSLDDRMANRLFDHRLRDTALSHSHSGMWISRCDMNRLLQPLAIGFWLTPDG